MRDSVEHSDHVRQVPVRREVCNSMEGDVKGFAMSRKAVIFGPGVGGSAICIDCDEVLI